MNSSRLLQAIVIGAGPAGMMTALKLAHQGFQVLMAEKQQQVGTKLLLSGNGRCNISNALSMEHWEEKIPRNPKFLHTAFNAFSNQDLIQWAIKQGVPLKEESDGKIFPESNSSRTILDLFKKKLFDQNVSIIQQHITKLMVKKGRIMGVLGQNGFEHQADIVVIATGGKSWPQTGSNGEGYKLAEEVGHSIITPRPSLAPIKLMRHPFYDLAGTSIDDVFLSLNLAHCKKNPVMQGNVMLTHSGISGPAVLDLSAFLPLEGTKDCSLLIDWLPAFSHEMLLNQWKAVSSQVTMSQWLSELGVFSQKYCSWFLKEFKSLKAQSPSLWPRQDRTRFLQKLKQYPCIISEPLSFEEGMVTAGGIDVREINSSTMESRKCKGLYFAGEVMDVDGLSGGFNLQIAFSTGYLTGSSALAPGG